MSKNEDGHCFFLESTKTKQHSPLQKAPGHAIRLLVARAPHFTPCRKSFDGTLEKNMKKPVGVGAGAGGAPADNQAWMERTYEHWDEFLVICYIAIDSIDSQGGKKKLSDELGSMITHKKYTCPLVICYIAIEKGPFIVDLPMKDGDFPVRYVCLPEGNHAVIWEKPRRTIRR